MKKVFLLLPMAILTIACSQTTQTTQEERVEQVSTMILQQRPVERKIQVSSNLQGYQTVNVAPSIQGKIEHIYVEVGDRKTRGDILVMMDENQYKTTKLMLGNLTIEKQRMDALLTSGSVSQQSYDQVKLNYDQTKVRVSARALRTLKNQAKAA